MKALKNKIPAEQYAEMYDIKVDKKKLSEEESEKPSKKEKGEEKTRSVEAKKEKEEKEKPRIVTEEQKNYGKILNEIAGSLKAVLFDKDDKEIKKIPVRELTDSLKKSDNISSVVFDGIITQRLLDIANSKNINEIIGIKIGNVVKMPSSVKVLTKKDLE